MGSHYRRDPDACTERAAPQGLSAVGLPCAIQASAAAGTPAPGAVAGAKSQPSFSAVGPASAPPVHRLRPFPENPRMAARTRRNQIGRAHVCIPVTNAHLASLLLPEKKYNLTTTSNS